MEDSDALFRLESFCLMFIVNIKASIVCDITQTRKNNTKATKACDLKKILLTSNINN